jgi:large conductance mechanosensitive channel
MPSVDEQVLAELREIHRLLTPVPPAPPPAPKGLIQEFKAFLSQYKVLGLAVAFILGIYLGALVKALVTDLILPIITLVLPPGQDFNTFQVPPFRVGDFANALLTFIIVAFVIFLIVKVSKRYKIE